VTIYTLPHLKCISLVSVRSSLPCINIAVRIELTKKGMQCGRECRCKRLSDRSFLMIRRKIDVFSTSETIVSSVQNVCRLFAVEDVCKRCCGTRVRRIRVRTNCFQLFARMIYILCHSGDRIAQATCAVKVLTTFYWSSVHSKEISEWKSGHIVVDLPAQPFCADNVLWKLFDDRQH